MRPRRKLRAYIRSPDSVSFVCTNKVRTREKNLFFISEKEVSLIDVVTLDKCEFMLMTGYRAMISSDINDDAPRFEPFIAIIGGEEYISEDIT